MPVLFLLHALQKTPDKSGADFFFLFKAQTLSYFLP